MINDTFATLKRDQQRHDRSEAAAGHVPEQVPFKPPRAAFGVVGAVGLGKSQCLVVHWNVPTSAVEDPRPKRHEQRLHDHRRAGNDETADDGEFPGISVATANRESRR